MSRDGSNIYSAPAGTLAVSGTTIESAKYNAFVNDLVADANLPRPIVAGGTGASTAGGWLAAMDVTATAAELNTLDGITATVAELNVLDGIPGTLTATEIGYLDGVTSPIQTQLNAKQAAGATLSSLEGLSLVAGDLLYATAADTLARLAKGAAGQVVKQNAGATEPEWGSGGFQWQTAVATTSGGAISLSASIPSYATEICISLRGASLVGTNHILVQLGTSGGFVTTGYTSSCGLAGGNTDGGLTTSGVLVFLGLTTRAATGLITMHKISGNLWSGAVNCSDGGDNSISGGGFVDIGGTLTQIRISASGADTFDAGAASVGWR